MAKISNERIPVARVRELLDYNPDTGVFTWRLRGSPRFDTRLAGKEAGVITSHGYNQIMVDHKAIRGARAAYAIMTGDWPPEVIDHINGDRADDRWENLRPASQFENCQNVVTDHNSTGLQGVRFLKKVNSSRNGKPYAASITYKGQHYHLGTYRTAEEAHAAYLAKSAELRGQFTPTRL